MIVSSKEKKKLVKIAILQLTSSQTMKKQFLQLQQKKTNRKN